MKLLIDLDLLVAVESLVYRRAVEQIKVRRGMTLPLEVQFCRGGLPVDIGAPDLVMAVKLPGQFDQDPPLFLSNAFTKEGTGTAAVWKSSILVSSAAIDTALVVDNNPGNDLPTFSTMAEFSWDLTGARSATERFELLIENNIFRDTDTPPPVAAVGGQDLYFSTVTAVLGAGGLDTVPTGLLTPPTLATIIVGGLLMQWLLQVQTAEVEDGESYVLPNDYHATTNRKVWVRVG